MTHMIDFYSSLFCFVRLSSCYRLPRFFFRENKFIAIISEVELGTTLCIDPTKSFLLLNKGKYFATYRHICTSFIIFSMQLE